jgi:hypothetical protein
MQVLLLLLFIAFLYAPYLLFKFFVEESIDLVRRKDVTRVEEFFRRSTAERSAEWRSLSVPTRNQLVKRNDRFRSAVYRDRLAVDRRATRPATRRN